MRNLANQKIKMAENRREMEGILNEIMAIHGSLKNEIIKILAEKQIKKEKIKELEAMLLKLYQDVVEESMKEYCEVTKDGARPPISVTTASSNTCATEGAEVSHLSQEQSDEVLSVFANLEAVIRSCTSKRKAYPQKISDLLDENYNCQKQNLDKYMSTFPFERGQSTNSSINNTQDCEFCVERLNQVAATVTDLSKTIERITNKAERLTESYNVHKGKQKGDTEFVLWPMKEQSFSSDQSLGVVLNSFSGQIRNVSKQSELTNANNPQSYEEVK